MSDVLVDSYLSAFGSMRPTGPKPLLTRVELEANEQDPTVTVGHEHFIERLRSASLNDNFRKQIHLLLATWDSADPQTPWTGATEPRSVERRRVVYQTLALDDETALALDEIFPVQRDDTIVISDEFEAWYGPERRAHHQFYWPTYTEYLLQTRGWSVESIASLDEATNRVVERLSDPLRAAAYQSKGLVVGYVQSGKTANFTGVLAKAVDAGYRLLIVLSGTVDILRAQTQRRLDMELVGVENILRGIDVNDPEMVRTADYQTDHDWLAQKFIRFTALPSIQGFPDIVRLTRHRFDYKSLRQGITALEFDKLHKDRPLYDPDNLFRTPARLVVVKKNKAVLEKLVKDLKAVVSRLGEIPALIIDDESDLASVNVSDPKKWKEGQPERTAINGLISRLLGLLPRSQYIGYTATPFANVFIDPGDVEDIFPKDYVISLERPPDYMGVTEFHDIDSPIEPHDRDFTNSNEKAHVRDLVEQGDAQDAELQRAMDSFVLTGALKLYRETYGLGRGFFRHHTMLAHESHLVAHHAALAQRIRSLWGGAGYSGPGCLPRLRELFESDFLPVSRARADGNPFAGTFDELRPFLPAAIDRIRGHAGDPVIIVNGDKDMAREDVEFEQRPIWRILVGGAKLSRGFTIEGLTISYYRRRTKQADTLMQMGRWFGFRAGYTDLVRLFIGRREPDGATTIDLYEAFDAIVRDEEAFREELRKYAVLGPDGRPLVRPAEIPPLVSQHLPTLTPTSRNKMFNAVLAIRRSPGTPLEPTAYPAEDNTRDLEHNYNLMASLLGLASQEVTLKIPKDIANGEFVAWLGRVSFSRVLDVLNDHRWLVQGIFDPNLEYLREIAASTDDCVIIAPQLSDGLARTLPSVGKRSLHQRVRSRSRGTLFHNISDPKHREAALRIAGARPDAYGDAVIEGLRAPRRGAMLLYPLVKTKSDPAEPVPATEIVIAFSLVTPMDATSRGRRLVQFKARSTLDPQAVIVESDVAD